MGLWMVFILFCCFLSLFSKMGMNSEIGKNQSYFKSNRKKVDGVYPHFTPKETEPR